MLFSTYKILLTRYKKVPKSIDKKYYYNSSTKRDKEEVVKMSKNQVKLYVTDKKSFRNIG